MQRLTMLVTSDAQWVLPDTPEFFEALGDPDPDYDSMAFAVKNLGFIRYQVLERSIVEVELHPRNVELPALLAVQHEVMRSQVTLFRIKFFDTEWRSEISSSPEHVVSRLSELCAPVFAPPPRSCCNCGKATLTIVASAAWIAVATISPQVAISRSECAGSSACSANRFSSAAESSGTGALAP